MNNSFVKKACIFNVCLSLFLLMSCNKENNYQSKKEFQTKETLQSYYILNLKNAIKYLDSILIQPEISSKKKFYLKARKSFKLAEPILAFTDQNNYQTLNAPNLLKVTEDDATDIKILKPFGFQVIEETLYDENINKKQLNNLIKKTSSRLQLIANNTKLQLKNYHIIWLIRNEITRIATTGITGFDSPVLNQSLKECQFAYQTLKKIIDFNFNLFQSKELHKKIINLFSEAETNLNYEFESFDRYDFIKNQIHPQLKLLVKIQKDWKVNFPFEMALQNDMKSLFSKETLNVYYFSDYKSDTTQIEKKIALGKALFNDKSLSKNYNMACATCHIKEKAFTDGRVTFNKFQIRNTPTVAYSAYQQSFFMDARSGSLEGQVVGVVENHNEFAMSMDKIIERVTNNAKYKNQLDSLYNGKRVGLNIRHAIASYIRDLNKFNSKFDKNIRGEENNLTASEKNGFNLFMGKALCATCHFAPVFNGTVPPNFSDTEMEAIGVPKINDTIDAVISDDPGRYNLFKTAERKHFFKTPTIRNVAKTAPYMHNGVFKTLEQVVDFYNRGGGQGIGIELPNQTLPFDNLNLTAQEQADLVAFMESLTDEDFVK